MTRAYTDYPRQSRFAHMAPIMGAVPIFAPRYGRGLGTTDPDTSTAPPPAEGAITPTAETDPVAPSAELALGAGTAALAGAAVGGVAAGSWRGAGIGAGMNVGVWAALTVTGHWDELTRGSRNMLLGSATVGLLLAGVLVGSRAGR